MLPCFESSALPTTPHFNLPAVVLQAPDLTLVPAVAAPGAYIQVKTMTDEATYVSGTSFSSPYTAGGFRGLQVSGVLGC